MTELESILEAILFASQKPLSPSELRSLLVATAEHAEDPAGSAWKHVKLDAIETALETLRQAHETAARTYRLACVAGAWQFVSRPEFAPWLRVLAGERTRPGRLSQPALETLTIIAYRQPITRAEMEQIRGVSVDGVLQTLVERGLVETIGRAAVVGRPMQYGTTPLFLQYFGLRDLESLPAADELRRLPVERPAGLATADPGLATAPPEQLTLPTETPPAEPPPGDATAPPAPPSSDEPLGPSQGH
ncbi:MAG TPA: SMC-Scp complex subunit ScpB [Verrucomicrobiota bacterium]|nr:SMC-Scp complex subunit ScpB [Verrucomicrobiota bacterium]HNU49575.1 SMC-Scp complex subunit ScpB [Verrucomicrobiota bacterium]